MQVTNPATEQVIAEIPEDGVEEIRLKFDLLKSGLEAWQKTSLGERIEMINYFSSLLEAKEELLALILTREMGKPVSQSRNELRGARKRISWLTSQAAKYLADETMTMEGGVEERIVYEPLGVIGNISAWNYPYLVGVNVYVPALLAGNAVLYKPSEFATLTGLEVKKLLLEAGIPNNIFQVVTGAGKTGEMVTDLDFDAFYFTGSFVTGEQIYLKMSSRMIPCHCELGGKDSLYVADDISDIKAVAASAADGAFYNNGQSCCAVERLYVHANVYERFIGEFVKEVSSYRSGSPEEPGIYIGPLTRPLQMNILEEQVADALSKGAEVLVGGHRKASPGYYFEPTVVVKVTREMKLMQDESFGPIIGIMKVKDDEEAIRMMQDSEYGLTASVYSSSQARAEKILKQIDTGTGYWNCCDRVSAPLPWSGRKHSGIGVTLSHAGLRAMTKVKSYHLIVPQ
ncbi:MAG: aldehyde dehydrogenase family protein [Chitinophagaceae bacterium]